MQITQSLHRALQTRPHDIATVFGHRVRTVAESSARVIGLAGALRSFGVESGERVGMYALNSDRYHEYLYAVPWAGGVVNPVNVRWSTAEVAYSLIDCATEILFVDDAFVDSVDELRARVPNLRTIVYCGDGSTPAGLLDYEEVVAEAAPIEDARRQGSDLYGIYYTGGTTGVPKGVMLDHRAMITSATGSLVTTDMMTRGGVLLHAAPMFHLADGAAWIMANLSNSSHVMIPSFTAQGVIDAVRDNAVTDALLVPTMIQALIDSPGAGDQGLESMRRVLYGASPISETVLTRAREVFGNAQFTQSYGMTELAPVATLLTSADHDRPGLLRSCGRAAAHAEVRIVDQADQPVPPGQVGEIVCRGDHVMQGYWNKPEESAEALRGGWMHTGDVGYMNDDGYFFVVDRLKDMIISGGENVYSIEVENALLKHPDVQQAVVVGVPDDDWGERVHAVVVLNRPGSIDIDEIRRHGKEFIAGYKLPRSVDVREVLPMSGAGKILKRTLRDEHWDSAERAVN